ncbi:hypothetical protein TNCV_2271911 [Trichonephila clavipes]|nr:hypothetical protein TNCV_2271911 [Trichonephila clavipes]
MSVEERSNKGVGAVLSQEQRPVVFASRTLSAVERNYTRGRHNREDQFVPEKADEGTIAPTSKSEQDQATRQPDEVVINDDKTRKEKKRKESVRESLYPRVLVGNANYKSHKNHVVSFLFILFRTSGRKNYCNEAKITV